MSAWWQVPTRLFPGNFWNWRWPLPVAAVSVALIFAFAVRNVSVPPRPPALALLAPAAKPMGELLPTVALYQVAANVSPQKLDDLLNAQASQAVPPVPANDVSMAALANAAY